MQSTPDRRRRARRSDQGRDRGRHVRDRRSAGGRQDAQVRARRSRLIHGRMNNDQASCTQFFGEQIRCAEAMLETLARENQRARRRQSRRARSRDATRRPSSSTSSRARVAAARSSRRRDDGPGCRRVATAARGHCTVQGAEPAQRHTAEGSRRERPYRAARRCVARNPSSTAPPGRHRRAPTRGPSAPRN